MDALEREKLWDAHMVVSEGSHVSGGQIICEITPVLFTACPSFKLEVFFCFRQLRLKGIVNENVPARDVFPRPR